MTKKIVLTGSESTGKTTLARALAVHFGEPVWLPEWARTHLEILQLYGRTYTPADVEQIAKNQCCLEEHYAQMCRRYLFCDTDLITCKIWLQYKYGYCPDWITEAAARRPYQLHLLCGTDVPWEYDPQRENPDEREVLYNLYKKELIKSGRFFVEVKGNLSERLKICVQAIENFIL